MDIHIRISRWVIWWFGVGVGVGTIALANVIGRDLTRRQDRIILLMGLVHWALGGIICWAFDGIKVGEPGEQPPAQETPQGELQTKWFSPSEFVAPGSRHSILPPRY